MEIFLVGGAVRDKLLNITLKDKDYVVVGSSPDEMLKLGFNQVGKNFPVFLHPKSGEEYALARTERKNGVGYLGFTCYFGENVTLTDDLARRDLTINAMAQASDGELFDPYNGFIDLKDKILRHVSPSFSEDPLRVLRVARFAARFHKMQFKIAPETLVLMKQLSESGELENLTPERVWGETVKALETDSPQIYFKVLRECGALKVLFPELNNLFGVPATKKWHPEVDTGIHTLMVVEQAAKISNSTVFRFACLVHDLGKGLTPVDLLPSHKNHGVRGLKLIKELSLRLKIPNEYKELALLVSEYHSTIHLAFDLKASTLVKLMDQNDAWRKPERFFQMLQCCVADSKGRLGCEEQPYPAADYIWQAFKVAQEVDVQDIIKTGITGIKIKEELHEARIKAVALYKNR